MPRVSIGMPVFNGENFLREALDSLLSQTFSDFELIISDNASTDATQDICQQVMATDSRVRYFRTEQNHGASWNHAFVIAQATAPYFKLAAHDDVCLPDHLACCVNALDTNAHAILAYTQTLMIHEGRSSMTFYQDEVDLTSDKPAIRYGDLIHEAPPAFPIFGVVRLAALKSIPGFDPYKASDRVVLTRLALLGPFIEIAEPLFQYRWHANNASNLMRSGSGFYTWWNPSKGQGRVFPESRLVWEHLRSIFIVPLSWRQRRQCLREWRHWAKQNWPRIRVEMCQLINRQPLPEYPPLGLLERSIKRRQRALLKARFYSHDSE